MLIVDGAGTPPNARTIDDVLARVGACAVTATTARDALVAVGAGDFALALLDAAVPDMDTIELAARIHDTPRARDVPILITPTDPRVLQLEVATFVALYEQRLQLAETLRLQETFVAAINHDLRGTLGTITLGLQLLADDTPPAGRDVLARVSNAAERMAQMLEQLYDVARTRLGDGIQLALERADLRAVIEAVVADAGLRGVAIDLDVVGDSTGAWDLMRIGRIATNLIGNAMRYGERGRAVTVRLDGSAPNEVRLEVRNAGAIAPELLPCIFEPFRRGNARCGGDGLGLGLYIVREIARAHGGDVAVTSTPDDGTVFEVRLPRALTPPGN